jgi:hypothetical protein
MEQQLHDLLEQFEAYVPLVVYAKEIKEYVVAKGEGVSDFVLRDVIDTVMEQPEVYEQIIALEDMIYKLTLEILREQVKEVGLRGLPPQAVIG